MSIIQLKPYKNMAIIIKGQNVQESIKVKYNPNPPVNVERTIKISEQRKLKNFRVSSGQFNCVMSLSPFCFFIFKYIASIKYIILPL